MLLEMLAVGVVSGVAGFFLGRRSCVVRTEPRGTNQRAVAYVELFSALSEAYSSVLNASAEDQLSEVTKQAMWNSLNVLSRTFYKSRFLFPADLVDVMAEWIDAPFLTQGWDERLEILNRTKEKAYFIARKEFASN
ncbi:hypothetical protein GALL_441450 [mine drainage metagenome]|uniref:Uncharacterized protein n=1 Tax=mine drainage metagenome TaxID=410659 RepID=A0A1J5Q2V7_9ZZZZ